MTNENIVVITDENFDQEVLKSSKPVLVDFWAEWCGPCRGLAPTIEELANEYNDKIKVGKINVDENMELARQFRVMSIPTVIIFKNGEIANKEIGAYPKEKYVELINNL